MTELVDLQGLADRSTLPFDIGLLPPAESGRLFTITHRRRGKVPSDTFATYRVAQASHQADASAMIETCRHAMHQMAVPPSFVISEAMFGIYTLLLEDRCTCLAEVHDPTHVVHHLSADYTGKRILPSVAVANVRHLLAFVLIFTLFMFLTSAAEALLLDAETLDSLRALHGAEGIGLRTAFFNNARGEVVTCFRNDVIMTWTADRLEYQLELRVPSSLLSSLQSSTDGPERHAPTHQLRCFALSADGTTLAAAGKGAHTYLWNLGTQQLERAISLPEAKSVIGLSFVADQSRRELLAILAQDGILSLCAPDTGAIYAQLGPPHDVFIDAISGNPRSRYLLATLISGQLGVYDVDACLRVTGSGASRAAAVQANHMEARLGASRREGMARATTLPTQAFTPVTSTSLKASRDDSTTTNSTTARQWREYMPKVSFAQLRDVLHGLGEYPAQYRQTYRVLMNNVFSRRIIWRIVLQTPSNAEAFGRLLELGTHPAHLQLHRKYPIKSRKLLRVLQRTLSCLSHWSPVFAEADFIAAAVFPFVKLFQNSPALNAIENMLALHDEALLRALIRLEATADLYAWPLLYTVLSEVFYEKDWLVVWDNILSNHPAYLFAVVVSFLMELRVKLMQCRSCDELYQLLHHKHSLNVAQLVQRAYTILQTPNQEVDLRRIFDGFAPLSRQDYPLFEEYPAFVVNYQGSSYCQKTLMHVACSTLLVKLKEKERIRREEMRLLKERTALMAEGRQLGLVAAQRAGQARRQELLEAAMRAQEDEIKADELRLDAQRAELQALRRQQELKMLQPAVQPDETADGASQPSTSFSDLYRQTHALEEWIEELDQRIDQQQHADSLRFDSYRQRVDVAMESDAQQGAADQLTSSLRDQRNSLERQQQRLLADVQQLRREPALMNDCLTGALRSLTLGVEA
ncbi:uncharacterized protein MONBRDRAFT_32998 [Monosiga brevicollis MX1]|uniref:TBC1 domain family member 31 n=1 Tax=Monosiga brevicollis TaxID=81824 RepID=A9V2Y5_MONBE|nr:uncharacterized protein MONBRDRAFT_32998 [Monosiga brevicollis MX1]EDQ88096.1 predicted protein [Monosiga brevicollis MX1]|eukprot:XP_001747172.1 hypothetical protein [Monosiga brevicollis MX1]